MVFVVFVRKLDEAVRLLCLKGVVWMKWKITEPRMQAHFSEPAIKLQFHINIRFEWNNDISKNVPT